MWAIPALIAAVVVAIGVASRPKRQGVGLPYVLANLPPACASDVLITSAIRDIRAGVVTKAAIRAAMERALLTSGCEPVAEALNSEGSRIFGSSWQTL